MAADKMLRTLKKELLKSQISIDIAESGNTDKENYALLSNLLKNNNLDTLEE